MYYPFEMDRKSHLSIPKIIANPLLL